MLVTSAVSSKRKKLFFVLPLLSLVFIGMRYFSPMDTDGIEIKSLAASSVAGTLAGDFLVDGNGSAVYSMPITSPPGTNGLEPQLSIEYNSHHENGLLGVGWQIAGVSKISRVAKTVAQDGEKGSISYTNSDRFALDGHRLIAVKSKNGDLLINPAQRDSHYGKDGTEYRTELETWTQVISKGDCDGGPCYFTARLRDGSEMVLGSPVAAKQIKLSGKSRVRVWPVSKVSDRNGNYLEVNYYLAPYGFSYQIQQISYTGNEQAGLRPQRFLRFSYDNRPDVIRKWQADYYFETKVRLKSIETFVDLDGDGNNPYAAKNLVKKYQLEYQVGKASGYSQLKGVKECDAAGTCLPETKFQYQRDQPMDGTFTIVYPKKAGFQASLGETKGGAHLITADFNGDGKMDFLRQSNNKEDTGFKVYLSEGNGSFAGFDATGLKPPGQSPILRYDKDAAHLIPGDFNGDGLADLLRQEKSSNGNKTFQVLFSSGATAGNNFSFQAVTPTGGGYGNLSYAPGALIIPGDYNGDGKTDFIRQERGGWALDTFNSFNIYLSIGDGFFHILTPPGSIFQDSLRSEQGANIIPLDYNGDGITDFLRQEKGAWDDDLINSFNIYLADGKGSFKHYTPIGDWMYSYGLRYDPGALLIPGDFNGDGQVDIIRQEKGQAFNADKFASFNILYASGPKTFYRYNYQEGDAYQDLLRFEQGANLIVGDYNGDGRSDFIRQVKGQWGNSTSNTFNLYLSNGFGTSNILTPNAAPYQDSLRLEQGANIITGDFNGDGTTDFIRQAKGNWDTGQGNSFSVYLAKVAKTDLLTHITNGLDKSITIQYKPITDSHVHTKGNSTNYPELSIQFPLFVVAEHQIQNSPHNPTTSFHYTHTYQGAKADVHRGWLGFEQSTLIDHQNNTLTKTYHHTDFPLVGKVSKRERFNKTSPNQMLSRLRYTYQQQTGLNNKVYVVQKVGFEQEHYTQGNYNYTLAKNYHYSSDLAQLVRIDNLGDQADPLDNIYTGFQYYTPSSSHPNDWWKAFFPITKKKSKTLAASSHWSSWNPDTDLKWERFRYNPNTFNPVEHHFYLDTDGGQGTLEKKNQWLIYKKEHDAFGNITFLKSPPNQGDREITTELQYDDRFHTFLKKHLSPDPNPLNSVDERLITQSYFDPRFGVKTRQIDENGQIILAIPDQGLDGFGRTLKQKSVLPDQKRLVTVNKWQFDAQGNQGMAIKSWELKNWTNTDDKEWTWTISHLDAFGRNFKTEASGYNKNTTWIQEHSYDARGQIDKDYLPYFQNNSKYIHYYETDLGSREKRYYRHRYDLHGHPTEIWFPNPSGDTSHYLEKKIIYDLADDRKVVHQIPNPEQPNQFIRYHYFHNTYGRVTKKIGPLDHAGNILSGTDTVQYKYDLLDRLVEVTDPIGQKSTRTYNSLGQIIKEEKAETGLSRYQYTAEGWLLKLTDAKGQEINYTYDDLGRITRKEMLKPNKQTQHTVLLRYDEATNDNGKGKLTSVQLDDGSYTYSYDNQGKLKEQTVQFSALDLDRDKKAEKFHVRFAYNPQGDRIQTLYPDQSLVKRTYNAMHEVNQILQTTANGDSTIASYSNFTAGGRFGQVAFQNQVVTSYTYDAIGRTTGITTKKAAYIARQFDYHWNKANKLSSFDDKRSQAEKNLSQSFEYNAAGRLVQARGPYGQENFEYDSGGNRMNDGTYRYQYYRKKKHQIKEATLKKNGSSAYTMSYDKVGNLTQKQRKIALDKDGNPLPNFVPHNIKYKYDAGDRLISVSRDSAGTTQLNTYTYDHEGRRTSKKEADGTTTYYLFGLYDIVVLPSGSAVHTRYVAGPQGLVQSKTLAGNQVTLLTANGGLDGNSQQGGSKWFPWWKLNYFNFLKLFVLASLFLCLGWCIKHNIELGTKLVPKNWLFKEHYRAWLFGLMTWSFLICSIMPLQAASETQAPTSGSPSAGTVRYFHQDYLGSSALLTDETGGLTNQIVYRAFGGIDQGNSSGADDFRPKFTGKELDKATGLYYFGSRYYDADLGRFISPDPAKQYHNPYVYGDDDPLSGVDPDGEFLGLLIAAIVAAVVGAYAGGAVANHTANPAHWDWKSGKTWAGIIGGGALGVAAVATGGAALSAVGAVSASAVTIGGVGASTIAATSADVAALTYDSYEFSKDHSAENGIYVGLDLIPFAGPLLGRAAHGIRALTKGAEVAEHEVSAARRAEEFAAQESENVFTSCPLSFKAGIHILTVDGSKAIEDIEVGDEVWAFNEELGENDLYPVSRIFQRTTDSLIKIETEEELITTTPEHPFYTKAGQWVEAQHLQAKDQLFLLNGQCASVLKVYPVQQKEVVYNFEVSVAHTYYITETGILVHNPAKPCRSSARLHSQKVAASKAPPTGKRIGRGVAKYGQGDGVFHPGQYANDAGKIKARSQSQVFKISERSKINKFGKQYGCHRCGKKGLAKYTPDHQPVSAFVPTTTTQHLYPHCAKCSSYQGGQTAKLLKKGKRPGGY